MPYIKNERRYIYEDITPKSSFPVPPKEGYVIVEYPRDPGELNYIITRLCDGYLKAAGKNYHNINEIIGVLECTKLEFYRRIAAPYEDQKIAENGDVY